MTIGFLALIEFISVSIWLFRLHDLSFSHLLCPHEPFSQVVFIVVCRYCHVFYPKIVSFLFVVILFLIRRSAVKKIWRFSERWQWFVHCPQFILLSHRSALMTIGFLALIEFISVSIWLFRLLDFSSLHLLCPYEPFSQVIFIVACRFCLVF